MSDDEGTTPTDFMGVDGMTPEREQIARDREDATTAANFAKARSLVDDVAFSSEQTAILISVFDELEKSLVSQQRRHDIRYEV